MSGYTIVGTITSATTVSAGATNISTLTCPSSKSVIGGGHELVGNATQLVFLGAAPTSTSWRVMLRNDTGAAVSNVQVRIWVICAGV